MPAPKISQAGVHKLLSSLITSKAAGPDNLSPRFLKELIGLAVLIVGALAKLHGPVAFGVRLLENTVDVQQSKVVESFGDPTEQLASLLSSFSIPLIVLGCFICLISLLGLFSSCCGVRILHIVYLVLVSLILFCEVLVFLLFVTGVFHKVLKNFMMMELRENYESTESDENVSKTLNMIMVQFECCGVDGYMDFEMAKKWNNTKKFGAKKISLRAPIACCDTEFVDFEKYRANLIITNDIYQCVGNSTAVTSHFEEGCFDKMKEELKRYYSIIYIVLGCAIGLQILVLVLGILAYVTDD